MQLEAQQGPIHEKLIRNLISTIKRERLCRRTYLLHGDGLVSVISPTADITNVSVLDHNVIPTIVLSWKGYSDVTTIATGY